MLDDKDKGDDDLDGLSPIDVMNALFAKLNVTPISEISQKEVHARAKAQAEAQLLQSPKPSPDALEAKPEPIKVEPQVVTGKHPLPINHPYRVETRRRAAEIARGVERMKGGEIKPHHQPETSKETEEEGQDTFIFGLSLFQVLMLIAVAIFATAAIEKGMLGSIDQIPELLEKLVKWLYSLL